MVGEISGGTRAEALERRGRGEWRQIDAFSPDAMLLASERADCSGSRRRAAEGLETVSSKVTPRRSRAERKVRGIWAESTLGAVSRPSPPYTGHRLSP